MIVFQGVFLTPYEACAIFCCVNMKNVVYVHRINANERLSMEKILVLNAGSTTLKFQLYNMEDNNYEIITGGAVERIGQAGSKLTVKVKGQEVFSLEEPMENHKEAIKRVLGYLTKKDIKNTSELAAVAHRMGYGGDYDKSAAIDDKVMQSLYDSIPLIPLHGPAIAAGIKAMQELIPEVLQVAVFDTAFHQSVEKAGQMYALPIEYFEKYKVRRYGFHGPSHNYVSRKAYKYLGYKGRFVCCHLGGGASVTAVKEGKSVMTSMGYTPSSGLVMSTRPGDIDPYIPLHIMKTQNKTADEVNALLNKQSGLLGLTEGHADMRDIIEQAENGNEKCQLALKVYVYNIIKHIGAAIAQMGGIDALIFTAGIGEKSAYIREKVCEKLGYLGLKLDDTANHAYPAPTEINAQDSAVKVLVIPTNEELMMAKEAYDVYMEAQEMSEAV